MHIYWFFCYTMMSITYCHLLIQLLDSHEWDTEERGAPSSYKLDRCPDINCYNDSTDDGLSDCTSKETSDRKQPAEIQGIHFPQFHQCV